MWKLLFTNTGLMIALGGTIMFKFLFSSKRKAKLKRKREEEKEDAIMQKIRYAIIEGYEVARKQEEEREEERRKYSAVEDDTYE